MKKRTALVITLLVLSIGVCAVVIAHPRTKATMPKALPASEQFAPTPSQLLALVNQERAKAGVSPLTIDARLNKSAQLKAEDMATSNYFDHMNPETHKHGYEYINEQAPNSCSYISENIHQGSGYYATATGIVDGWMHSKEHREALLNPRYTSTGFGIQDTYSVEHFCQNTNED